MTEVLETLIVEKQAPKRSTLHSVLRVICAAGLFFFWSENE